MADSERQELLRAAIRDVLTRPESAVWELVALSAGIVGDDPGLIRVFEDETTETAPGCPFCDRWLHGEFERCGSYPSMPVIRFEPLNPVTPGHMLFLPASHEEHPAPEAVGECMKRAAEYAEDQGGDYNLITSSGASATQTIAHMHVHYVPRREDDRLTLPWTGQKR